MKEIVCKIKCAMVIPIMVFHAMVPVNASEVDRGTFIAPLTLLLLDDSLRRTPPSPKFTVSLPQSVSGGEYLIDFTQWEIEQGLAADPSLNSINMQAAIDFAYENGYRHIRVGAGHVVLGKPFGDPVYYYEGLRLPSGVVFEMEDDTILEMRPNSSWNYCLINTYLTSNVTIRGGQLQGDRDQHEYVGRQVSSGLIYNHDEGHGVCVTEANHVLIEEAKISKFTGDGVFVVGKVSHDIIVRKNEIFNNRRQGVSVVGSHLILIEDNLIHSTKGTPPQFGVDIEATAANIGFDRDIIIQRNTFHSNRGGGVTVQTGSNVFVLNNTMTEKAGADFNWRGAGVTVFNRAEAIIQNNVITKAIDPDSGQQTLGNGIIEWPKGPEPENRQFFIHDNTCIGCGLILRGSKVGPNVQRNNFGGFIFWILDVENLVLIDNSHVGDSATNCFSIKFQRTSGNALDNLFNSEPIEFPLKPTELYDSPYNCPFVDINPST